MLGTGLQGQDSIDQMRTLGQNMAGAQSMGAFFGGHDQYQKSANLVNAIDVLGGGRSLYAQNALSKLGSNPQALADILSSGVVPPALAAMGIKIGDVRAYANRTLGTLVNRFVDDGKNDDASRIMRDLRKSGDFQSYFREHQGDIDKASGVLAEMAPGLFQDSGAAAGFIRDSMGLGRHGPRAEFGDAAGGTGELRVLQTSAKSAADQINRLSGTVQTLTEKLAGLLELERQHMQTLMSNPNASPTWLVR
jgi:hypothetical protein